LAFDLLGKNIVVIFHGQDAGPDGNHSKKDQKGHELEFEGLHFPIVRSERQLRQAPDYI
jgi:hypothetical protein